MALLRRNEAGLGMRGQLWAAEPGAQPPLEQPWPAELRQGSFWLKKSTRTFLLCESAFRYCSKYSGRSTYKRQRFLLTHSFEGSGQRWTWPSSFFFFFFFEPVRGSVHHGNHGSNVYQKKSTHATAQRTKERKRERQGHSPSDLKTFSRSHLPVLLPWDPGRRRAVKIQTPWCRYEI